MRSYESIRVSPPRSVSGVGSSYRKVCVRTHLCPFCGYLADRDVNAAKNILKAGARPSGVNVSQEALRFLRSPSL